MRSTWLAPAIAVGALILSSASGGRAATAVAPPTNVDLELVLAVDISRSMDYDELALQRNGYVAAIQHPDVIDAIQSGAFGRIAVTYVEWAGEHHNQIIVPWRLIDGPEAADGFAADIARARYTRASRTSIAGAMRFAALLFESSGYRGIRRVLDISGDGANNSGPLVAVTRDELLAKGITINGLPIMLKRPSRGMMDIDRLDIYYEDCVIGGPGAFVVPVQSRDRFKEAIRTKLLLEVAGRMPEPRVVPASAEKPRIPCTIGERLWQERWGN
jgi:hypothetical protein